MFGCVLYKPLTLNNVENTHGNMTLSIQLNFQLTLLIPSQPIIQLCFDVQ